MSNAAAKVRDEIRGLAPACGIEIAWQGQERSARAEQLDRSIWLASCLPTS
jgi:hypothetical protein